MVLVRMRMGSGIESNASRDGCSRVVRLTSGREQGPDVEARKGRPQRRNEGEGVAKTQEQGLSVGPKIMCVPRAGWDAGMVALRRAGPSVAVIPVAQPV